MMTLRDPSSFSFIITLLMPRVSGEQGRNARWKLGDIGHYVDIMKIPYFSYFDNRILDYLARSKLHIIFWM